ncbi:MAG: hypothetical protein HYU64_14955 [Armatimonadetes bacterium]|nr:hypothetical protein [Armatimonadota bacterium]
MDHREMSHKAHKWLKMVQVVKDPDMNRTNRTLEIKQKKRVRTKSETESRKDDLVKRIGELAKETQELAREAVQQYSAEVEAILKEQGRDSMRIERCLDGMLDFCFDHGMLVLYKRLCRYYLDIDPEATVSYVNAYREMWDEQEPSKRDKTSPTTKCVSKEP